MHAERVHSAAMTEDPVNLLLDWGMLRTCENQCCEIRPGFHFVLGTTVSEEGLGFCSVILLITLCPTREQHPENTEQHAGDAF